MREVLTEIQDGRFAREWIAEYEAGNANYKAHEAGRPGPSDRSRSARSCARKMPWLAADAAQR